jgi:hypothetical protein
MLLSFCVQFERREVRAMRMPVLSYFLVAGTSLIGLLFWASNRLDPNSVPIKTSQTVGLPAPFKAPPEQSRYKIDGVNFAATKEHAVTDPTQPVKQTAKQKANSKPSKVPTWNRLAESPQSERLLN